MQELSSGTPTANLLTGLGIDEFFTRTDSAGVRNYLTDALGSSVALADGSGTIQTEYTYEPFGATTTLGGIDDQCVYVHRSRGRRHRDPLLSGAVL